MRQMFPLLVTISLVAAGCTCDSGPQPPTPQSAAKKTVKRAKTPPKPKVEPVLPEEPVLGALRWTFPVTPVGDDGIAAIQAKVFEAVGTVAEDPASLADDMPREWKCRRGQYFPASIEGSERPVIARVFERYNAKDCGVGPSTTEKWEYTVKYEETERPTTYDGGGSLEFALMALENVHGAEAGVYHTSFKIDTSGSRTRSGPFPHDVTWMAAQGPEGLQIEDTPAGIHSRRWAVAQFRADGERVVVEYHEWSCATSGEVVGAEVSVGTTHKAPEHTPRKQLDVVAPADVTKVAEALPGALGASLGGEPLNAALAMAKCAQ